MSGFEPVGLQHRPLFLENCLLENSQNSSDCFGNVYLWDLLCRRNVARLGDRLGIEYLCPRRGIIYNYPSGKGPLTPAVEALRLRAAEQGAELCLWGITPPQKERLEAEMPGTFSWEEDRANFDYIYSLESMATLAGKKLHGKRNFCNRFEKSHTWSFVTMTPDRFDDCRDLLQSWEARQDESAVEEEKLAIERVFREWDSLGMTGGVLYAEGRAVAFTIGERLRPDTMDVHFEKADADIPGAYPMVAREFARYLRETAPELLYLNREEDMGLDNLRKAKEEWKPLYLLPKFTARWSRSE